MVHNPGLEEVEHPETKAKLTGIQEIADDFGLAVAKMSTDMEQKRGVVAASKMISSRIQAEVSPFQKLVDDGKMDPDEAKIRREQILSIVRIVDEIALNNQNDMIVMKGRIQGLQTAAELASKRFHSEVGKYERHKRMFDDEEDDLNRPPAEEDESFEGGNGKNKPKKASSKSPKKTKKVKRVKKVKKKNRK